MNRPAFLNRRPPIGGIIGIGPDIEPCEGYDETLFKALNLPPNRIAPEVWQSAQWSANERRELADYMIGLWQKYRDQIT
jgi:hypothetical protein